MISDFFHVIIVICMRLSRYLTFLRMGYGRDGRTDERTLLERCKNASNKAGYTALDASRPALRCFPRFLQKRHGPTDRPTDTPCYRVACMQLKTKKKPSWAKQGRIHGPRCVSSCITPFCAIFSIALPTDGPTDRRTDRRTDGHTLL